MKTSNCREDSTHQYRDTPKANSLVVKNGFFCFTRKTNRKYNKERTSKWVQFKWQDAAVSTHQSKREAWKQRRQAKNNVWTPNRKPELLRHVVMTTLWNTGSHLRTSPKQLVKQIKLIRSLGINPEPSSQLWTSNDLNIHSSLTHPDKHGEFEQSRHWIHSAKQRRELSTQNIEHVKWRQIWHTSAQKQNLYKSEYDLRGDQKCLQGDFFLL